MTIAKFLGQIRNAIIAGELVNGKVLIATAEAGGSTTFAVPPGFTPADLVALFQEAIDYANQWNNNPPKTARRITRLRASFFNATPQ